MIHDFFSLSKRLRRRPIQDTGKLLDILSFDYLKSKEGKEKQLIRTLLLIIASEIARRHLLVEHFTFAPDGEQAEFAWDVALSFIRRLEERKFDGNSLFIVRNLCRIHSALNQKHRIGDRVDTTQIQETDVNEQLEIRDILNGVLENLSPKCQCAVMYLLRNPEEMDIILNLFSDVEKFRIYSSLCDMLVNVSKEHTNNVEISFMKSQTANVLFLSSLYKFDPKMLVLLTLVKDMPKFFQFCELFGGSTFKIPSSEDVKDLMRQASYTVSKLEGENSLSLGDKEMLLRIASDINMDHEIKDLDTFELTPIIDQYLRNVVDQSVDAHRKHQERVVNALDVSKIGNVKKLYSILNFEFDKQLKFIKELYETLASIQEMSELLKIMHTRSADLLKAK